MAVLLGSCLAISTLLSTCGCAHQAPPQIAVPIKHAERSIVSVRYTQEDGIYFSRQVRRYYNTTGFYIDRNLVVTTAYYLLPEAQTQPADYTVRDGDWQREVKDVHYWPELVLVILEVEEDGESLELAPKVPGDEPLIVVGLQANRAPLKGAFIIDWQAIPSRLTKDSQEMNRLQGGEFPIYFIDKKVPRSLWGSPLINNQGKVIGIVTTGPISEDMHTAVVVPVSRLIEARNRVKRGGT
jgi:hypothetical protein